MIRNIVFKLLLGGAGNVDHAAGGTRFGDERFASKAGSGGGGAPGGSHITFDIGQVIIYLFTRFLREILLHVLEFIINDFSMTLY